MNLLRTTLIAAVAVLLCLEGASADVKLKQKSKNSGFAGIGASESEKSAEAPKAEPGKPGHNSLFSMTTEVLERSTTSVSPSEFEVPAGYKKKD